MNAEVRWKVGMLALHEDDQWGVEALREVLRDEDEHGRVLTEFVADRTARRQWVLGRLLRPAPTEIVGLAEAEGLLREEEEE